MVRLLLPGKKLNINSPTLAEGLEGILTIPGGSNSIKTVLTHRQLLSESTVAIVANPALGGNHINAGE